MDRNWDTDNFSDAHLPKTILCIHACAYRNDVNQGDELGNPPTNHWVFSLALPEQKSIRLDMMPGYGSDGLRGKLEITHQEPEWTDETIKTLTMAVAEGTRVKTITDLISANKRQKYTFTEEQE